MSWDNGKGKAKKIIADVAAGAVVASAIAANVQGVIEEGKPASLETNLAAGIVAGAIKIKGNNDSWDC